MPDYERLLRRLYRASAAYFLLRDIGIPEALHSRQRVRMEMLSALADVQFQTGEGWVGEGQEIPPAKLALLQEYCPESNHFKVGDLGLNRDTLTLTVGTQPCHLTQMEYTIMAFLMSHPGRIVTHQQISRMLWGEDIECSDRTDTLRVHIRNIRQKIEQDPANPRYLVTIIGHGYTLHTGGEI